MTPYIPELDFKTKKASQGLAFIMEFNVTQSE